MSTPTTMPAAVRARLESLLAPGELVRWRGASDPHRRTIVMGVGPIGDGIYVIFAASLLLGGLGMMAQWNSVAAVIVAATGALMLPFALLSASTKARERARIRRRVHAVTDRRVISISDDSVWAVEAGQLTFVGASGGGDGWGDVTVHFRSPEAGADDEFELTLAGIPDIETAVHAVEHLIAEHAGKVPGQLDLSSAAGPPGQASGAPRPDDARAFQAA